MEKLIFIEYDADTAETVCRFSDKFSKLPAAVQLDVAKDVCQRFSDLAASLEAIIARSGEGSS